ncbi:MAG: hypothetical protein K2G88_03150, partial [Oscillospiraceae bacterium]|nr:hypothetical protein [Oscillospiraceae bacterium]
GDNLKKICIVVILLLASCLTGCKQEPEPDNNNQMIETLENNNINTELESEPESETEKLQEIKPINVSFPETDFNALTFNDRKFSFVSIINDEDTCAEGTLSVENIDGNFMLKFTDLSTNADNLENAVQKICISVDKLLNPDQLESVFAIGFDSYAQAKDNFNIESNIFINGGTVCANGEQYNFEEVSVSESNAYHVKLKFENGKYWDNSQENINLMITCSGMQNSSDLYFDNIIFYDQEGNSIPLNPSY